MGTKLNHSSVPSQARTFVKPLSLSLKTMKLQAFSSCLLIGFANAGFQSMKDQMTELTNRYIRSLIEANRPQPRAISDILTGENFDRINEYGCWCYFEDDHGRGHGKPVNGIDHFCKKLADGYDCCMLDFEELSGNDSCVPWEVRYLPGTGTGESNLNFNCDGFNTVNPVTHANFCANCACKVEGIFVLKVFNLFIAGGTVDQQYSQPTFDEKAGCPLVDGIKDTERACCGEHPHRFPYKPLSGERGCCGGQTFDTTLQECCPDNVARITC